MQARDSVKSKDYSVLLSLWTLRFGLIAMLVMSYEGVWTELISSYWDHQLSMWLIVTALLGASLWLAKRTDCLRTLIPVIVFCLICMLSVVFLKNPENAIYLQVICNIALVVVGIRLIMNGIESGISHYFFLGVATILLTAFMRYIDLIGEYVGGAILFMVLAAVLLGSAKYWKTNQIKLSAENQ